MFVRKTKAKGISISKIEGFDLPFDINKNVASVSAMALLEVAKPDFGFEIEIYKKIKPRFNFFINLNFKTKIWFRNF